MAQTAPRALLALALGLLAVGAATLADDSRTSLPEGAIAYLSANADDMGGLRLQQVAFSADGHLLATQGSVFDMETFSEIESPACTPGFGTFSCFGVGGTCFTSDGQTAISFGEEIVAWRTSTAEELYRFPYRAADGSAAGVFYAAVVDTDRFLVADYYGGMALFRLEIGDLWTRPVRQVRCYEYVAVAAALSPDLRTLATTHLASGAIRLWSVDSLLASEDTSDSRVLLLDRDVGGTRCSYLADQAVIVECLGTEADARITSIAFSSDSRFLASGTEDGEVWIWDLEARDEIRSIASLDEPADALAFCGDGRFLAIGTATGALSLWDLASGQRVWAFQAHAKAVTALAVAPDQGLLASASIDGTLVWDLELLLPSAPQVLVLSGEGDHPTGVGVECKAQFADSNSDLAEASFSVLEGPLDDFTLDLTQSPYAEQVAGLAEGEFSFDIVPPKPGSYRIQLTLVDATLLESEPFEFSFEAYTPTSPVVSRMTFPDPIDVGADQNGLVRFEDPDGDIVEAQFEVIEGDPSTIEIDPGFSFDPEIEGETDGAFRFSIRVTEPQTVTLSLTLVDAAKLKSESHEFTFDVR